MLKSIGFRFNPERTKGKHNWFIWLLKIVRDESGSHSIEKGTKGHVSTYMKLRSKSKVSV